MNFKKNFTILAVLCILVNTTLSGINVSAKNNTNKLPAKKNNDVSTTYNKNSEVNKEVFEKRSEDESSFFDNLSKEELDFLKKQYKSVTKEEKLIYSIELLKTTIGKYSHDAILGKNLTGKPIKVQFKNLSELSQQHASFDALGWKKSGKLNIYINEKHQDAPPIALAALLSHEALHQDELDSLNEETYAWTMEALVWNELSDKYPNQANKPHPLVTRENTLKKLLQKGNYTDKYIRKSVFSNPGYKNLPTRSPGFEDQDNL